ncbi:MAG: DUF177 domain-containing protein [Candidatus Latescibacterota bacterium]
MPETMPRTPLPLRLDELAEGTSRVEFEVTAEQLDLQDPFLTLASPLQVRVEVRRSLEAFDIRGHVHATAAGECCRCLVRTEKAVDAQFVVLLQRHATSPDEAEAAAEQDDMDFLPPGTKEVDLGDRVRDAVIIDLPVRLYCSEDCRGLCPRCGHDLNHGPCTCTEEEPDQRWEALRGLKFT